MKLKNARTASTRFYQITKKHGLDLKWNATTADGSSGATTDNTGAKAGMAPKSTTTKRKRGKQNAEVDEDKDDEEPAAAKKTKTQAKVITEAVELAQYDTGAPFK